MYPAALILLWASHLATGQIFGPNLRMIVSNTTSSPVEVVVNGGDDRILVPAFATARRERSHFGGGTLELSFAGTICGKITSVSTVPPWAGDVERWGATAAITPAYLEQGPTEDDLKRRVEVLKKALDGAKVVGRDGMKHQLDAWFGSVKKTGTWMMSRCSDPVATAEPVKTSLYFGSGNQQQVTVYVRKQSGRYRLSFW